MKTARLESAFESEVVAHLVQHGWYHGDRTAYRRDLGLDPTELLVFVQATPAAGLGQARRAARQHRQGAAALVQRVADELTSRGTVDVLRRGA